jgi:hypothetical protein
LHWRLMNVDYNTRWEIKFVVDQALLRIAIGSAQSFFQFGQHLEAPHRAPVLKYGRGEKGSIRSRFNNLRVNIPLNPKKQIISNNFRFYTSGNPDYSQFLPPLFSFFSYIMSNRPSLLRGDRGLKSLRSSTNKVTISAG